MIVNYLKEPGFVYDLITMIVIVLNNAEFKRKNLYKEEDFMFFENIINQCSKISDDILPFFYIEKNNSSFMSTYCLMSKNNISSLKNYTINNLISEISDTEQLKNSLSEYYFGSVNKNNNNYYDLIENTNYNHNIKYRLTRIFSDIPKASKMLIDYINKLVPVLENIYSGFDDIINERINKISDEKRIKAVLEAQKFNNSINDDIYFSICIISRYATYCMKIGNEILLILGEESINNIDEKKDIEENNYNIDIFSFGKAISDQTRFKILELLKGNKEIYTSEICELLNISLTTVSYHLNMMLQEKLLKTRNEGRKVFYSINQDYLSVLGNKIINYNKN